MTNSQYKKKKFKISSMENEARDSKSYSLPNFTKIIATMSPSVNDINIIKSFIKQGVSIFRINFSHGTDEEHEKLIKNLRQASTDLNQTVTICLDTKGIEFRITLIDSSEINVKENDVLTFSSKRISKTIHIPIEDFNFLTTGTKFYVDDGFLALEIVELGVDHIKGRALNSHRLQNNKKANFPGFQPKDKTVDIKNTKDIKFGIKNNIDVIFASFINNEESVLAIKEISGDIPVFSKIETIKAIENIDSIIEISDGIMVARGDLGVETVFVELFSAQKCVSRKCIDKSKPVICATQMLESMTSSSIPLRSEISDIGNAVLDGYDAVMLSGETAVGSFPLLCTDYMKRIITNAEDYKEKNAECKGCPFIGKSKRDACVVTETSNIQVIKYLYNLRLGVLIYVISSDKKFLSLINLYRGVIPLLKSESNIEDLAGNIKNNLKFKKVFQLIFEEESGNMKNINIL